MNTRLRKLDDGELRRDHPRSRRTEAARPGHADPRPVDPSLSLPAPGQGAIAAEILASDRATRDRLAVLDDAVTRLAVTAERAAARKVAGSCHAPFAAHARFGSDRRLRLEALVADDAGRISRSEGEADVATEAEAIALGEDVAGRLDWSGPAQ